MRLCSLPSETVEPNAHTGLTHEDCRSSRTRKPVSVVYLICVLSGQGSAVAGGGRARRGILLTLPMAWHTAVLSTDAYDVKAKAYYNLTTTLVTRDVQFCFWFHNIAAA